MSDALDYATWADAVREGRLLGLACDCGHTNGSPTAACPHCGERDLERVELPTTGVVHTETTIQVPPSTFDERGYQVVIVELGDVSASSASGGSEEQSSSGAKVTGRVEDGGVGIGDEVQVSGVITEDDDHPAPLFEAV